MLYKIFIIKCNGYSEKGRNTYMIKKCIVCGKKFNSKNGIITCSDMCYEIRNKERLEKISWLDRIN